MKQYVALENNVFVRERKQVRKMGVFEVPNDVDADYSFGTVVSAGPGGFEHGNFVPMSVVVGDEVVFPRTVGSKIYFVNNEELILVRSCDIIAKITDVEQIIEEENVEGDK